METAKQKYINGPFLKENTILYRQYQQDIINKCKNKNSLVVLPTGLGKTIIGILMISHSLNKYSDGKILILAPTRPLISQHEVSCRKFLTLNDNEISSLTGRIQPDKRIKLYNTSKIIISTPQVIKNDLERGRYDLNYISLIIFDEAHRTKGNYSYNFISSEYVQGGCSDPLLLGLTASPGKDLDHIQQICDNLFIEIVIFKSHEDKDVREYFHEIDIFIEKIDLSIKIIELKEIWSHLFNNFLKFFIERGLINPAKKYFSKLTFLGITRDISISLRYGYQNELGSSEDELIDRLIYKDPKIIDIINEKKLNIQTIFSYCSSCISLLHAKELLETQDISLFKSHLDKIKYNSDQEILSSKRIAKSKHFKLIYSIIEKEGLSELSHPKIKRLKSIIKKEFYFHNNKRIIIFTQYREMAEILKNQLSIEFNGRLCFEKFIGQSTKRDDIGFSQQRQSEIIEMFGNGKINVLIATSVAEEGLDIPNVDAIIFYEPVPSEIRTIQRRGRTGRFSKGRCYLLITNDTIDEPFYKVALRKELTMKEVLLNPKKILLCDDLPRKKIQFPSGTCLNQNFLPDYEKRKLKEKEYLANRSIDEIINELDNFKNTEEYINLKNYGITFYSDLLDTNRNLLKNKMLKIKQAKNNSENKKKKYYLNKNLKTLINITRLYSENGTLDYSTLQKLAREEDIIDKMFLIHFTQACNLGYLIRNGSKVHFIKNYE
ncbi:MAG: helicase-related protein [Promethearchaeota archaeon]